MSSHQKAVAINHVRRAGQQGHIVLTWHNRQLIQLRWFYNANLVYLISQGFLEIMHIKTPSRQSLLTHDRKRILAYNEAEQYKSVVFNRAFPSLYKKLDEQES